MIIATVSKKAVREEQIILPLYKLIATLSQKAVHLKNNEDKKLDTVFLNLNLSPAE